MAFDFKNGPFENLLDQIKEADSLGIKEPTAMSLATANRDGLPDVRAVLFKGLVRDGLSFYTNYESQKAKQLIENPHASVLFFWAAIQRQVRVLGRVERLTREESESYFKTRPRLSQIGAWASFQSQEIPNFDFLSERVEHFEKKFSGQDVPCPPNWGGFHLLPSKFEFWFGREGRLHERFVYHKQSDANSIAFSWRRVLLSP